MAIIELAVLNRDVTSIETDLLILKHARAFYGADLAISSALTDGAEEKLNELSSQVIDQGSLLVASNSVIQAPQILFVLTNSIGQLCYNQIKDFAQKALSHAAQLAPDSEHVSMTIHGVGFGLEMSVAFLAQLRGILEALRQRDFPSHLKGISIVERNAERASLLQEILSQRFFSEPFCMQSPTGASLHLNVEVLNHYSSMQMEQTEQRYLDVNTSQADPDA